MTKLFALAMLSVAAATAAETPREALQRGQQLWEQPTRVSWYIDQRAAK